MQWHLRKSDPDPWKSVADSGISGLILHYDLAPRRIVGFLKPRVLASHARSTAASIVLEAASKHLSAAGLLPVALKGCDYMFRLYPDPALRECDDIDILVTRDRAAEAAKVLADSGFRMISKYNGSHMTMRLDDFPVHLEIHDRLVRKCNPFHLAIAPPCLESVHLRRVEGTCPTLSRLSDLDCLEYSCYHYLKHGLIPGKWSIDIMALASLVSEGSTAVHLPNCSHTAGMVMRTVVSDMKTVPRDTVESVRTRAMLSSRFGRLKLGLSLLFRRLSHNGRIV